MSRVPLKRKYANQLQMCIHRAWVLTTALHVVIGDARRCGNCAQWKARWKTQWGEVKIKIKDFFFVWSNKHIFRPLARHPAPSDLRKGSSESPPWPSQEKLDQSFVPACLLYIQCQVVWRHGEHLGSPIHVTNVLEEYMYACWLVYGCFGAWLGWLIEHGGPLGGFWRGRCWFVDELLPQQRGINGDKAKELNVSDRKTDVICIS